MYKADCEELRRDIKHIADKLRRIYRPPEPYDPSQPAEAYANATLAYRHLEDASMRLGKAIQAIDGGTSVYDKEQVPVSRLG